MTTSKLPWHIHRYAGLNILRDQSANPVATVPDWQDAEHILAAVQGETEELASLQEEMRQNEERWDNEERELVREHNEKVDNLKAIILELEQKLAVFTGKAKL